MDTVKGDLFPDVVYVFTPKGDVRELPQGSTPVDFAYAVHTDIGHQCVGAKINGKIVPIKHVLRNGDRIEVITQTAIHRAATGSSSSNVKGAHQDQGLGQNGRAKEEHPSRERTA